MKRIILNLLSAIALPLCVSAADQKNIDADNSGKNQRDRDHQTLTSGDQSSKPEDIKLTQSIRKAIMKDDSLTMTAKNVKIITTNGKVTLRGAVKTAEEKNKISAHAQAAAGQIPVVNLLEIKSAQ